MLAFVGFRLQVALIDPSWTAVLLFFFALLGMSAELTAPQVAQAMEAADSD